MTDYLACSLLLKFNNLYPGITLSTFEMPQDAIEAAIAEDRVNIGIAFTRPISPDEPQSGEIEVNTLFEENICLAVGNAHPRAGQKTRIPVREFAQESLVLLDNHFVLRRHIDAYCSKHGITPRIAMETDSLSVIIEMIQASAHATLLPSTIIRTQCGLYSITLSPEVPRKVVTVICRKNGYRSPPCRAFAALASAWAARGRNKIPIRKLRPCPLAKERYQDEDP